MDSEQLEQFEEYLRTINELLAAQSQTQSLILQQMESNIQAEKLREQDRRRRETEEKKREDNRNTREQEEKNREQERRKRETEEKKREQARNAREQERKRAEEEFRSKIQKTTNALGQLVKTIISSERTFSKYNTSLSTAGDAALAIGRQFGILGTAIGLFAKGLTLFGEAVLTQTDNMVSATDVISRLGGAGSVTSQEFLNLAHNAGVTSKNLELIVNPLKTLESGLVGLGAVAGEGVIRFSELTEVTSEQREQFRRLGIDQSALIESQAAYIQLQNATGRSMQASVRSTEQLRRESLLYARNLAELAQLTGKDIDVLKQEQQQALAEYTYMIHLRELQQEELRLRELGLTDEADAIARRREVERKLLSEAESMKVGPQIMQALRESLATGGAIFTDETSALARLLGQSGTTIQEFIDGVTRGEDVSAAFRQTLTNSVDIIVKELGTALKLGGEELGRLFGITTELLGFTGRRTGVDETEAALSAQENVARAMESGFDRAMTARARLTEIEIKAGVEFDRMINRVNPLTDGFSSMHTALYAAIGALTAFSGSLLLSSGIGMLPRGRGGRGIGGAIRDPRTGRFMSPAQATQAGLTRAAPLVRTAGVATAAIGAGMSVYGGVQTERQIQDQLATGEISEVEARRARTINVAGTSGEIVGTVGGALAGAKGGAAAGAAIGSIVPGAGTAIGAVLGGFIGAGLGAWAVGAGGRALGETIGGMIGEEINLDKVAQDISSVEVEIELARIEGKSAEEIQLLQEQLYLQEQLKSAIESGNIDSIRYLNTEIELNRAIQNQDEDKIQSLSRINELEFQRLQALNELNAVQTTLTRLQQSGVELSQEQLERFEKEIESKNQVFISLDEQANVTREMLELQNEIDKISNSTNGIDAEQLALLESQLKLRHDILEAVQNEGSRLDTYKNTTEEILELQNRIDQINNSVNETSVEQLALLESQLESKQKIIAELQNEGSALTNLRQLRDQELESSRRKLEIENQIAEIEERSNRRWSSLRGRRFIERDRVALENLQNELSELSSSQIISSTLQNENINLDTLRDDVTQEMRDLQDTINEISNSTNDKNIEQLVTLQSQLELRHQILTALQNEGSELNELQLRRAQELGSTRRRLEIENQIAALEERSERGFSLRGRRSAERDRLELVNLRSELSELLSSQSSNEPLSGDDASIMGARDGGLFTGPNTGYPIELHGTELVTPINPNSVLMELAKTEVTPKSEPVTPDLTKPTTVQTSEMLERVLTVNTELMKTMVSKLDSVVEAIENGNDINDKIFKHSI